MTWGRPCLQVDNSPLSDFLTNPDARIHNEKQTIVLSNQNNSNNSDDLVLVLVNDCRSDVSPVNNSDSDLILYRR